MGGVFSQIEGFTNLGELWGPMAFHAVCTGLGAGLLGKALKTNPTAYPGKIRMGPT